MLDDAAQRAPDRVFLVERDARRRWRQIGFATAAKRTRRIAAALRALGASETRPLMILSGNGIDHALLALGAARAAIPVAPIDASLGLTAHGVERLRAIADVVRPAVVFARDGAAYASAVRDRVRRRVRERERAARRNALVRLRAPARARAAARR